MVPRGTHRSCKAARKLTATCTCTQASLKATLTELPCRPSKASCLAASKVSWPDSFPPGTATSSAPLLPLSLASIPLLPTTATAGLAVTLPSSSASLPAISAPSIRPTAPSSSGLAHHSTWHQVFPPIQSKLVRTIQALGFVEMRDLLPDNIALAERLEALSTHTCRSPAKPPETREVEVAATEAASMEKRASELSGPSVFRVSPERQYGFCIGIPPTFKCTPIPRNLQSAHELSEVVQSYLDREVKLGRMANLSTAQAMTLATIGVQISPFGVIPKRNRPDKWRLIVNVSAPTGVSANDAIDPELSPIAYTSVDDAAHLISKLGHGCLLAKFYLQEAYRAVPVHPADQAKLGVQWKGATYIDRALPFGLRSAPKLFSALTDGFMWCLHNKGIQFGLHYLDDCLLLGPAETQVCHEALAVALALCDQVGLPVAPDKTEGPTSTLIFLGIELDTNKGHLRLPQDKKERLLAAIAKWTGYRSPRRSGTKRDLLSLIGLLNHAAKVVHPGRAFIRSLIDASTLVSSLDHYVHLSSAARQDLMWWHAFLHHWNGISVIPCAATSHFLTSDASGNWGCGAVYQNLWMQLPWPQHWANVAISTKELAPIVLAVATWGPQWSGHKVCAQCDNMAVVYAINKKSARNPILSRLLRLLSLFCAIYDITLVARHLPGANNTAADALSRDNLSLFLSLNPQASPMPTVISGSAIQRAYHHKLSDLDRAVDKYFGSGIAHSTRSAYSCVLRRYLSFCHQFNMESPFPLIEATLCRFVAFLGEESLKHRTIKSYLSGLRFAPINQGIGNPFRADMPRLEYVVTGIKREEARKGSVSKPRLPITIEVLIKLKQVWLSPPVSFNDKMLWAAACTGFFGFLRAGEFTVPSSQAYDPDVHLSLGDLAIDSHEAPSLIRLTIKQPPSVRAWTSLLAAQNGQFVKCGHSLSTLGSGRPPRGHYSGSNQEFLLHEHHWWPSCNKHSSKLG